jgi:integrase
MELGGLELDLLGAMEVLGHADVETTQIYAHYAPSSRDIEMVNRALTGLEAGGGEQDGEQTEEN